jgi:hypothetical protein
MKRNVKGLLLVAALAGASVAMAQGTAPTTPQRDLNKEAEAQKSSASGARPEQIMKKEQKGKLETQEQKEAAAQELQSRSGSSAKGGPATVDKTAKKANPAKSWKDMTPEERKAREEALQKAAKP